MVEQRTRLSVIVPAYNEERRLDRSLPQLLSSLDWRDTELIFVDDGSVDRTCEVARRHFVDLPRVSVISLPRNRGKGAAVRAGVVRARADVIAYMDADVATELSSLDPLVDSLDRFDVAVGSRTLPESVVEQSQILRTIMGRGFRFVFGRVPGLGAIDTQCGFKAFRAPVAKLLFHAARIDGFAFDVELLSLAARLGFHVTEVPIRWTAVRGSHVRVVRDSLRMALDAMRLRFDRRRNCRVNAVFVPEENDDEALAALQGHVRTHDAVVGWRRGLAVLLPCAPPSTATLVSRRLSRAIGCAPFDCGELSFASLERSEDQDNLRDRLRDVAPLVSETTLPTARGPVCNVA